MFKAETLCLPWACISACRRLAPDAGWDAMACGPLKKANACMSAFVIFSGTY